MLKVDQVHKSFGKIHAVRGVTFELAPGQVTGLLGPNGAGKTTTIRMMSGYHAPDRGRVSVAGFDTIEESLTARQKVGYLPESAPLYPEMKTRDYLEYRARLFGMTRAARRVAIEKAIEACWLKDVRNRRVGKLSKGYKQRVGLAASLLHDPPILILDEPTNGLDPTQIQETRKLIRDLAPKRVLLVSSHILGEVEKLCDRVIIMANGQVRADASPAQLVEQARANPTYIVQCKRVKPDDDERAFQVWMSLPHVSSVEPNKPERFVTTAGWSLWLITAKATAPDLREAIAAGAMSAGILVRELRRETPSLEKVFVRLMEGGAVSGREGSEEK